MKESSKYHPPVLQVLVTGEELQILSRKNCSIKSTESHTCNKLHQISWIKTQELLKNHKQMIRFLHTESLMKIISVKIKSKSLPKILILKVLHWLIFKLLKETCPLHIGLLQVVKMDINTIKLILGSFPTYKILRMKTECVS